MRLYSATLSRCLITNSAVLTIQTNLSVRGLLVLSCTLLTHLLSVYAKERFTPSNINTISICTIKNLNKLC